MSLSFLVVVTEGGMVALGVVQGVVTEVALGGAAIPEVVVLVEVQVAEVLVASLGHIRVFRELGMCSL